MSVLEPTSVEIAPPPWWGHWLPAPDQMVNAIQLNFPAILRAERPVAVEADSVWATSMRQGMGQVIGAGIVAGILPFLVNWFTAARVGAVAPLAGLARGAFAERLAQPGAWDQVGTVIADLMRTLAGLQPAYVPGWMAAGVSALGVWINQPLTWLALWIVYGLGVLAVAKVLGAPTTLQRFYALTSYAFLPLVLVGLAPIPCFGVIASVVGLVWGAAVYFFAVRAVTDLDSGRVVLCMFGPWLALLMLLALIAVTGFFTLWFVLW